MPEPAMNAQPHRRSGWTLSDVHAVEDAFILGWALFWFYWFVAAFSMKRGRVAWSRELPVRVAILVVVVVLIRLGVFRHAGPHPTPGRAAVGLALFAAGLAFAVWARVHLGRNWGTPMSQKREPELITRGPYRLVRHPIYTGILLAGLGTAVALSWPWLIGVALAAGYFVYSALIEERNLARQLPDDYPDYRRATKMLVPYVF